MLFRFFYSKFFLLQAKASFKAGKPVDGEALAYLSVLSKDKRYFTLSLNAYLNYKKNGGFQTELFNALKRIIDNGK